MRSIRPIRAGALISALVVMVLTAAPVQAATYQYWSYFHATDGAWSMAMEGATYVPEDGTIEGWRYVETSGDEIAPNPRVAPDFASICSEVEPVEGKKRVGLVIDFGTVTPADERDTFTTCLSLDADADGFAVLQAAATITADQGMVSCIQGVPSASCEPTPDLAVTTSTGVEETTGSSISVATVIFLTSAVVVTIAYLIRRRRA